MAATAEAPAQRGQALATTGQQGRQLTARDQQFVTLRSLMEAKQREILAALPKHITPGYFMRVVLTALQRNPQLLECDPITFLGAILQCAQLGLVPDGFLGQAYLIPYKNNKRTPPRLEVQFQPGYKGLIALARRSGDVSTIHADVVHERDHFRYIRGFTPVFEHVPSEDDNAGALVKVYAWYRLKDGGFDIHVMNRREVYKIRERSQAYQSGLKYNRKDSPWFTDEEWMWKKTCLKQLLKLAPMSTEIQHAAGLDDAADIGLPQDLAMLADETEQATPIELTGEEDRESIQMPQRASEQPAASTAPEPEPELPAAADRVVEVTKNGPNGAGKVWWTFVTERGLRAYTWSTTIGPQLAAFKANRVPIDLTTEKDARGENRVLEVSRFDALAGAGREPGAEG